MCRKYEWEKSRQEKRRNFGWGGGGIYTVSEQSEVYGREEKRRGEGESGAG